VPFQAAEDGVPQGRFFCGLNLGQVQDNRSARIPSRNRSRPELAFVVSLDFICVSFRIGQLDMLSILYR
jgi:hypothetical protein